jgi:hypothetical protein
MNKREYLVSKNLAKPGRGKFSRAAHAELQRATAAGVVFDDGPAAVVVEATVELPNPTVIEPIVTVKVRDIGNDDLVGFTEQGWRVGFTCCRRCGMHANFCNCREGLLPPSIVETLDDRTKQLLGS